MTEIKALPKEKLKEIFESSIKKYICIIEFPEGKYGKGILCKMPSQKYEIINAVLTNHKFEGIDSNKQIKLTLFDGEKISFSLKSNDKDSTREFYQDKESGMTMIEILEDQNYNFLKIDKNFYLYDNMEVYLIDFCSENNLDCCVGLIPENEKLMDEDNENVIDNKIEIFCFNKKKSSGGIMVNTEKNMEVIGFHFGNNNVEGKYWNSCMYLFHFIRNYYYSKNWKFLCKHKRKDDKENQNDQNNQSKQNEQENAKIKEKDNQRTQPKLNEQKNGQQNNIQKNSQRKMLCSSYSPFVKNNQFNENQVSNPKNQQMYQQVNNQSNQQNIQQMNKLYNQQVNSPMNQQIYQKMNNPMNQQMNNPMNQQMNNPMNQQMNNQMNQQMNNQMNNPMNQKMNNPMNQQMNNPMNQQMNNPMNQQMNNQMNQKMNQQINQQMNNPMNRKISQQINQQMNNPMNQQNFFPQNNLNLLKPMTGPIKPRKNNQNNNIQNMKNVNPCTMGQQNIKINNFQNNNQIPESRSITNNNALYMKMKMNYGQYNVSNFNQNMNYNPNINLINPNQFQNMNYFTK